MYSQIGPRESYLLTVVNTAWLYPTSNIEAALAATTVPYTRSGNQIVAATIADLNQIAIAIYENTVTVLLPQGFNMRPGLLLKDLGKVLTFKTTSGALVAEWRLARLITDQIGTPGGGAAPPGTVGYLPIFYSEGNVSGMPFDPVRVVRVG
jgi:hypothetical protein